MKRNCVLLLTIGVSFMSPRARAVPIGASPPQTSADSAAKSPSKQPSHPLPDGRVDHEAFGAATSNDHKQIVAGRRCAPAHTSRIVPTPARQIPKSQRSPSMRQPHSYQLGSNGSHYVASGGLSRGAPSAMPAQVPKRRRPANSLLTSARQRGTNSAVIGGAANQARSSAALDGSEMKRRP